MFVCVTPSFFLLIMTHALIASSLAYAGFLDCFGYKLPGISKKLSRKTEEEKIWVKRGGPLPEDKLILALRADAISFKQKAMAELDSPEHRAIQKFNELDRLQSNPSSNLEESLALLELSAGSFFRERILNERDPDAAIKMINALIDQDVKSLWVKLLLAYLGVDPTQNLEELKAVASEKIKQIYAEAQTDQWTKLYKNYKQAIAEILHLEGMSDAASERLIFEYEVRAVRAVLKTALEQTLKDKGAHASTLILEKRIRFFREKFLENAKKAVTKEIEQKKRTRDRLLKKPKLTAEEESLLKSIEALEWFYSMYLEPNETYGVVRSPTKARLSAQQKAYEEILLKYFGSAWFDSQELRDAIIREHHKYVKKANDHDLYAPGLTPPAWSKGLLKPNGWKRIRSEFLSTRTLARPGFSDRDVANYLVYNLLQEVLSTYSLNKVDKFHIIRLTLKPDSLLDTNSLGFKLHNIATWNGTRHLTLNEFKRKMLVEPFFGSEKIIGTFIAEVKDESGKKSTSEIYKILIQYGVEFNLSDDELRIIANPD